MTKKYNSMAVWAFEVDHDDFDDVTEEELRAGFEQRLKEIKEYDMPLTRSVGGDISDTHTISYDDDGNRL